MNIQRKNSAHHFRMQSECEQTLVNVFGTSLHPLFHTGTIEAARISA